MVKLFTHVIIISLNLTLFLTRAQNTSDINSKQSKLKTIKNEISSIEKEILNKSKKEKESFNLLQNYDKQNFLLNKVIGRYRSEEKQKEDQITESEQKIKYLSKEIFRLQTNYAKYVSAIYHKGKQTDLAVIFDSESISQALRRIFYLKKFSESREKDLINLEKSKNEFALIKSKLQKEREEKAVLVDLKMNEEKILEIKTNERRQILNALRKDQTELKKELDTKRKAETTIRNIIARLSEEKLKRDKELKEKLRTEEEERIALEKKGKVVQKEKTPIVNKKNSEEEIVFKDFTSFEQLKGKLTWPVSDGKIIKKYGENKNLILKTISLNYGVDIKVSSDQNVKAVSNGIISAIEWIPGYGSIIIISHSNDYRTVYSHLAEIYVQEGAIVKTGQLIGAIGESIDGNVLHFEIWNSRANQNPEIWLAKK